MSHPLRSLLLGFSCLALIGIGLWGARSTLLSPPRASSLPDTLVHSEQARSIKVETVVEGLEVPWGVVFTHPHRMLVTERPGRIRAVVDGKLAAEPLITLNDVASDDEEGLLGIAVHPRYPENRYLYVAYTYKNDRELKVRVIRAVDEDTSIRRDMTIVEEIPAGRFHAGTALKFGPDEKLYISTGDGTTKESAQDPQSLAGKFLRLNDDGSVPSDNPFSQSPVFTLGHRNPQGFDWHPETGRIYATEHGPSGFDGPGGGDEINFIEAGKNYGWPSIHHTETKDGLVTPLISYTPAEAPSGAYFYNGDLLSQWKGDFFFAALKGEGLWRLRFDTQDPTKVVEREKLFDKKYGRIRAVTAGPDGAVYFATSNRDGRGTPKEGDDKILRIVPDTAMP